MLNAIKKINNEISNAFNAPLTYEAARELAGLPEEYTFDIITIANKIRVKNKNNDIFTCSIINAKSGFCSEDCKFCSQSSHHNTNIETYPLLSENELIKKAVEMGEAGVKEFSIVTSGLDLTEKDFETICSAAKKIKEKTDLTICTSIGIITPHQAKRLIESGVTKYHHNIETARSFFDNVCTTHDYDDDINAVKAAKEAGLEVCCGCLLGMGETWDQRVEIAFTLKELNVASIPINFLNPIPGTAMEKKSRIKPMDALKCIALFRIINPDKDITICGGRNVTLKDFQSWVFIAGANGLMIGNYLTTKGRDVNSDLEMITDMGLNNVGI